MLVPQREHGYSCLVGETSSIKETKKELARYIMHFAFDSGKEGRQGLKTRTESNNSCVARSSGSVNTAQRTYDTVS